MELIKTLADNGWAELASVLHKVLRELKERRADEEWMHKNAAMPVFYLHGVNMRIAGEEKIYTGPTLRAAILAARGGRWEMMKEEKEVLSYVVQMSPHHAGAFKKAVTALVKAVREDCAKVAEDIAEKHFDDTGSLDSFAKGIAAAIRRKGK